MQAYHDVHTHNYLSNCCSDGTSTVENCIAAAQEAGLKILGISNHTWDARVPFPSDAGFAPGFYKKQTVELQMEQRKLIPADTNGVKVLVGAETEYCGMYDVLGMTKESAKKFDYLLIPHTHVHMAKFVMPKPNGVEEAQRKLADEIAKIPGVSPERALAMARSIPTPFKELAPFLPDQRIPGLQEFLCDFMVNSFRSLMLNKSLNEFCREVPVSIAHPFQPVGYGFVRYKCMEKISENTFGELFTMAAERGIGLEINGNSNHPQAFRLYGIAKECGCKFTLGSDTHCVEDIRSKAVAFTQALIDHLSLTEDDMMVFLRL